MTTVAQWVEAGRFAKRYVRGRNIELVLERCSFEAAASVAPEVVCEINLGLAEGLAESVGGQLEVSELVARNPLRPDAGSGSGPWRLTAQAPGASAR